MKRLLLLFLLLFLLLPVWGFADELPAIYTTPHGLRDSTVILHIPAKYYDSVSNLPIEERKMYDESQEVLDHRRLCKDYTGNSKCYLMSLENADGQNFIGTSKTDAPFVYVIIKQSGGKAVITVVGGWNEN